MIREIEFRNWRTIVAGFLLGAAVLLGLLNMAADKMIARRLSPKPDEQAVLKKIDDVVEAALRELEPDRSKIRTRNVQTPGNAFSRVERSVRVAVDFLPLKFNQSLSHKLEFLGVRVIGSEKSKENITTLHLVRGGRIIQSIILRLQ